MSTLVTAIFYTINQSNTSDCYIYYLLSNLPFLTSISSLGNGKLKWCLHSLQIFVMCLYRESNRDNLNQIQIKSQSSKSNHLVVKSNHQM